MNSSEHVYFIGIGGYGMSAIAKVMIEMGYRVSGSDMARQESVDKLEAMGATIHIGHRAEQITDVDLVVYSTALSKDNVEIVEAESRQIPVIHRSDMLAKLMLQKRGIAVAGAHGKTTTSSMISLVLERGGWDPTFIIGGELLDFGSNAKAGRGEFLVAEADESDGSFLKYRPEIAMITNIEADHLENYEGNFENLKRAYAEFLNNIHPEGTAIVCSDDPYVNELIQSIDRPLITYGIEGEADYRASNLKLGDRKIQFTVSHGDELLGELTLNVPGKHNVYNALCTLITCMQAGMTFAEVAENLPHFGGAKRRFHVLGEVNDILVIDDYAHHPTEIVATIAAAQATNRRIIAIFQPQRYSRTFFLLDEFSHAFAGADQVIVTDIYAPVGEQKIEGINSAKLATMIKENSNPNVLHIATKEEVFEYLQQHVQAGDLVLTMGAGDIWRLAVQFVQSLD